MAKVKILKAGETDIDSDDIWRFAIHSDYPNVKIKYSGSHTFTLLSGSYENYYTINHNLGYVPQVWGWVEKDNKSVPCNNAPTDLFQVKYDSSNYAYVMPICFADTTQVKIGVFIKFPVGSTAYTNYTFTAHWRIAVDNT